MQIPDVVTHYHRADRAPFLSLCDLETADAAGVMAELPTAGSRRRFGPRYLPLRHQTEHRLRTLFVGRGGRPERTSPHYFVLGASAWFAGLYDDPRTVELPLSTLPRDQVSITLPDSITAMELGVPMGVAPAHPEHAGRVYLVDELSEALARHDPRAGEAPDYEGHQRADLDVYVEVQLWSDAPLRRWVSRGLRAEPS